MPARSEALRVLLHSSQPTEEQPLPVSAEAGQGRETIYGWGLQPGLHDADSLCTYPCHARMAGGKIVSYGGRPTGEVKHVRESVQHSKAALVGLPQHVPNDAL